MSNPTPSTSPSPITYRVTTAQVQEHLNQRAEAHMTAAAEWKKRSEDTIWCQRTSILNKKMLNRQAMQQGTSSPDAPDAKGIAEFALTQMTDNIDRAAYARTLRDHVTPNATFELSQVDFLELVADISKKIMPKDPPEESKASA